MPLGVYAWIGINFVLGRFEHTDDGTCLNRDLGLRQDSEGPPVLSLLVVCVLDRDVSVQVFNFPVNFHWSALPQRKESLAVACGCVRPALVAFLTSFSLFYPEDEAIVEVHVPGSENREAVVRKRTVGILDMGGVSTQIAYEVPKTVSFASSQQVIICATSFFWFILMHISVLFSFVLSLVLHHITERMPNTSPSSAKQFICTLSIQSLFQFV